MKHLVPVLALFAAACLPIPHPVQDLPRVRGTITSNGAPVPNVRVQVADLNRANPCDVAERSAMTDASGAFATKGRRRLALWVGLLPFHSTDSWGFALIADEKPIGFVRPWNYGAGLYNAPKDVELTCDIAELKCDVHDLSRRRRHALDIEPCVPPAKR